jgi:hypothetical protein
MNHGFGMESPRPHDESPLRPPARYLVLIEGGGSPIARLFTERRAPAGEFDASSEEVALMTRGLVPVRQALGSEWDEALEGHSRAERATAEVYTLDV